MLLDNYRFWAPLFLIYDAENGKLTRPRSLRAINYHPDGND